MQSPSGSSAVADWTQLHWWWHPSGGLRWGRRPCPLAREIGERRAVQCSVQSPGSAVGHLDSTWPPLRSHPSRGLRWGSKTMPLWLVEDRKQEEPRRVQRRVQAPALPLHARTRNKVPALRERLHGDQRRLHWRSSIGPGQLSAARRKQVRCKLLLWRAVPEASRSSRGVPQSYSLGKALWHPGLQQAPLFL